MIQAYSEVAADLVQDTLLAALEGFANFKGDAAERTWLTSILRNKTIDYLRKAARRELPTDFQESNNTDSDNFTSWGFWNDRLEKWKLWDETPLDKLEQQGLMAAFEECLGALPLMQRAVLTLRSIEALPIEEVCNSLDISASNVGVLLFRARFALRRCLSSKWYNKK